MGDKVTEEITREDALRCAKEMLDAARKYGDDSMNAFVGPVVIALQIVARGNGVPATTVLRDTGQYLMDIANDPQFAALDRKAMSRGENDEPN